MAEFQDSGNETRFSTVVTLQGRLEALFEVGRLLSSLEDIDALLERILSEVHDVMQCRAASMLLRVPGTDLLEFVNARGRAASHIQARRIRIGEGISGEVARTRQVINVADAYKDDRFNPSFDKTSGFVTKQILAAPMIYRDSVVGVLSVMNRRSELPFTPDDERILSIFSDQCSIAITNAQERRKSEQKNRVITIFSREIGRILSSELTLVYGYLHQTKRFLAKTLADSAGQAIVERVNVPLGAIEKSTDSLVRISRTLNVFTRSTENVNFEILSIEEMLSYFLKETKFHRVRAFTLGHSKKLRLRLPRESLFLVLESLVESLMAPLPKDFDVHGSVILLFRARANCADFFLCCSQEWIAAAAQAGKDTSDESQSLLSLATMSSIVESFDGELIGKQDLEKAKTSDLGLDKATPFQVGREMAKASDPAGSHPHQDATQSAQVVRVLWQVVLPLYEST
jgi:hypothetical protein